MAFFALKLLSVILFSSITGSSTPPITNEKCEYEIDLVKNTVRAVCQGQPVGVQVFTNTATIISNDPVNQTEGSKSTSGRMSPLPSKPVVRDPGYSGNSWYHNHHQQLPRHIVNSTAVLEDLRRKLLHQATAMDNITAMLVQGDANLRTDLEALRKLNASQMVAFRESIIATMRNQYNFMKTAILAQNVELSNLLTLLISLVTVSTENAHSVLNLHDRVTVNMAHVNHTMLTMRKMFSAEVKKKNSGKLGTTSKRGQCPRAVSAFGSGDSFPVQWKRGVVMWDAADQHGHLWIMAGEIPSDQLLEYDSDIDVQYHLVSRYYSLPFFCEGTGHVVYQRFLYCHKSGTRIISKYNLQRMEIAAELELTSAGVNNEYPYQFRLKSDIDLAVDELGLWVIYSTDDAAGKIVISKLNPQSLTIENTWMTSYPKQQVGNSFMICGTLYATNSYSDAPTFIRYVYDTNSQEEQVYEAGEVAFQNAALYNSSAKVDTVMLDYNPRDRKLYSWSNAQIQSFPVYFKEVAS